MSADRQIHFFSTGNQELPTGGNIFNHSLLDEFLQKGIEARLRLLPEVWDGSFDGMKNVFRLHCIEITPGNVLILDSLVFGYLAEILPEFRSDFLVTGLVHLPLSMHPGLDEKEIEKRVKFEKAAIEASDLIIATSPFTGNKIESVYSQGEKVEVIMPGIRFTERKMSYREIPHELIVIANVLPSKGYHFLLDILGRLLHFPWHLTCVGDFDPESSYFQNLQRMMELLGLKGRVRFTGLLARSETIDLLRNADLMLLPSELETYGMVIAEAISHGVPVVANHTGGTEYAFRPGCGALLPQGDDNEWLNVLSDLLSLKDRYKEIIEQVKKYCDDYESWDKVAEKMTGIIDHYYSNKFG